VFGFWSPSEWRGGCHRPAWRTALQARTTAEDWGMKRLRRSRSPRPLR